MYYNTLIRKNFVVFLSRTKFLCEFFFTSNTMYGEYMEHIDKNDKN